MELNPGAETFNITLQRDNQSQSWGFRLQGGKDFPTPLSVSMVNPGGIGEQFGIKTGDAVLQINGVNTDVLEHEQAKYEILKCGNHVNFLLQRGVVKVWKPQVTSFAEMKQGQPGNLPPGYDDSFVQKTSLAANKGDPLRIGSAHNRTARPFAGFGSQPASQPAPPPANPPSYNQPPQQQYSEPPQQQYSQPPQQQYSQPPQQQYSQPPQQQYSQPQQQHGQQQQQYGQQPQQYGGAPQYGQASPDQPSHQPQYSPQGGGYVPAEIDDGIGGKGLVHAQYNSPMGMYSNENVMDTFQIHATVLAQDLNKNDDVQGQPGVSGFKSVRAPVAKPPSEKQPAQLMTCKACGGLCTGVFVRIKGDPMHPECFKCVKCGVHLKNKGYFVVEGRLYCDVHAKQVAQPPAPGMVAVPVFK